MVDALPAASPNPSPQEPPRPAFWPRSVQGVVAIALLLAFIFLGRSALSRSRAVPANHNQLTDARMNINRAGHAELMLLPGIGDVLAERILDYREQHGAFKSVDELRKIKGIGPATFERLKTAVAVGAGRQPASPKPSSEPRVSYYRKQVPAAKPAGIIDVNTASPEELQSLPGIGVVLAQRIVEERARKPFATADELRRVKGIGPKTLEKVRPFVIVDGVREK